MQSMNTIICEHCGSNSLYEENGFLICSYCGTRHLIPETKKKNADVSIHLNKDVDMLLKKCRDDPNNAKKYAELILQIDPNNYEASSYLYGALNNRKMHTAIEKSRKKKIEEREEIKVFIICLIILLLVTSCNIAGF